ncbi:DUF4439 domain-containing protein [Kineococcus esterisolvens]|uniref:DUF4439 domain-containing protein n=1 Tax=unclassified Kineococcus TaxID=2621656 RepID=UPI003D7ECC52
MPTSPSPAARRPAAGRRKPGRRTVLTAFTALVVTPAAAGCGVRWVSGPETTPAAQRGPDDEAREEALADARRLLALALPLSPPEPVSPRAPVPTQQAVAAVVDACTAHVRALGGDTAVPASTPAADEPAALVQELAAAAGRALAAVPAVSGGMARLLCSVAASRVLLHEAAAAGTGTEPPDVPTPEPSPSATPAPAATAPSTPPGTGAVAALQSVLAGEHAAVWAYGLVAGRLGGAGRDAALAAAAAHREARDALAATLRARGAQPVGAEAAYDAAAPTPEAAVLLAVAVEERLAAVHADLAAASRDDRLLAAAGVVRAARAARNWGGTTTNLPGLPEVGEDGLPLPAATAGSSATGA